MTIDWWTLGIQSVNIVILIWLLGRFFWRPVAAMIEERRQTARAGLEEAESKRNQASAALADIEKTRLGFAAEREAILDAARDAAKQERATLLARASTEIASMQAAAKAAIAGDVEATRRAWEERASRLAVDIAERLAARLDGPAVQTAFLNWLLKGIRELPETARRAATQEDAVLDAVSSSPIEPADQQRHRDEICAALGGPCRIHFKVDPNLIAGLELNGPHFTVSNSWRADLSRTLAELIHADRS